MKECHCATMTIHITGAEIVSGLDTHMPIAGLKPGQSVAYKICPDARGSYMYKADVNKAITFMDGSKSMCDNVDIDREDHVLTIKIKQVANCPDNKDNWAAKATLFFDAKEGAKNPPNKNGLDPVVTNSGSGGHGAD
jgi:hypothetical protein